MPTPGYLRCVAQLQSVFGVNYVEFADAMKESRAIISGSFVLKALLDARWTANNIDIYVNSMNGCSKIERFLTYRADNSVDTLSCGYYNNLDGCKTYEFGNHKIQLFLVKDDHNLKEFISSTADLLILNNWFVFDDFVDYIHCPGYLYSSSSINPRLKHSLETVYRVKKYKERGIRFEMRDLELLHIIVRHDNPNLDVNKLSEIEKILF